MQIKKISLSKQEVALLIVTLFWGATFFIVHTAMRYCDPSFFVGLRFFTAGVLCAIFFRKALIHITRRDIYAGVSIGVCIYFGYFLQTLGLTEISSSMSAFMTALYVPLVPLLQWWVLKKCPSLMNWVGIILAFIGLVLLSGISTVQMTLSMGEIATLVGAVAIASEIILISRYAGQVNTHCVTVVQLLTAGVMGFIAMPVLGESLPAFSWIWVIAAVGLGCMSLVIQWTMNWAQQSVSPTRATIIYAGEPVWGGIFGRLAGDKLPHLAMFGAALIVMSVIVSELKLKRTSIKHKVDEV